MDLQELAKKMSGKSYNCNAGYHQGCNEAGCKCRCHIVSSVNA